MSRRIEIELTSARPDGSWTWRVAGAKQPKGVLDGAILPSSSKVGDVLRADAEFELEGTTITSVVAPAEKRPPERLALLGDGRPFEGVTTSLVPKSPRRRERPDGGDRREGRGPRPEGPRPAGRRPEREGRAPSEGQRDARRPAADARGEGRADAGRPSGDRRPGPDRRPERSGSSPTREPRRDAGRPERRPDDRRARPEDRRPKRLVAGTTHRTAVLEGLAPEERAVAEQLLNGGVPALRRALQEQNVKAREEGHPEVKADALIALAEELLPRLKAAEWRDRAEAAVKEGEQVTMRDLRSVVAGADAGARDDESRTLAKTLRETLDHRETAERDAWIAEMTECLDSGKVTRALRVAGRPPDPRTRFPAELSTRLTEAASDAMSPETPPDRWAQLLAALLESPVRRAVKPRGLPPTPGDPLVAAARQAAGRVPALAPLLGLTMPPPPGPPRGARRPPPPMRPPGSRPATSEQGRVSPPPTPEQAAAPPAEHEAPVAQQAAPPAAEQSDASKPGEAPTERQPEHLGFPDEQAEPAPPTPSAAHAAEPVSLPYGPEAESGEAVITTLGPDAAAGASTLSDEVGEQPGAAPQVSPDAEG